MEVQCDALRLVAEAADDLVIGWANYAPRDPRLVEKEDALIDALEKLKEASRV